MSIRTRDVMVPRATQFLICDQCDASVAYDSQTDAAPGGWFVFAEQNRDWERKDLCSLACLKAHVMALSEKVGAA